MVPAMKMLTVSISKFDDFARLARHTDGLVFVHEGSPFDRLFILPNKQYPLVYECVVETGAWHELDKFMSIIPAEIERESA